MSSDPFRTSEASERGFTRGRLAGPQVRQLFPGVHVEASVGLTLPLLVSGASRLLPADALVTGVTAIRLLGVPAGPWRPLRFVTTHPHLVRRPGLHVTRVAELPPTADGVAVRPEHAFVRSAETVDLVELVSAGDRLVRLGATTPEALTRVAAAARGRGVRAARRAAHLVRARVDSAQETELRLCLVLAGLPEPACNPIVGGSEAVGRVDLRYREFGVLLEYEGDQHRTDRRQWNRDIERYEQFTTEGLTVVRVTAERMRRPQVVVARVLQALRAGGYLGPDPVLSAEWCALFSSSARLSRLQHAFEVLERTLDDPG